MEKSISTPFDGNFKNLGDRVNPAFLKKGIINKVFPECWTADVILVGSPQTILKAIPLASHIDALSVQEGDKCKLDLFDETNPTDMVVAYIYGRKFKPILFRSDGLALGVTELALPHGLGRTPDFYTFITTANPDPADTALESKPPDATNFFLKSVKGTITISLIAVVFG